MKPVVSRTRAIVGATFVVAPAEIVSGAECTEYSVPRLTTSW